MQCLGRKLVSPIHNQRLLKHNLEKMLCAEIIWWEQEVFICFLVENCNNKEISAYN